MTELTFKGFLIKYIKQLSSNDTINIKKLVAEACRENPRLKHPLFLYACVTGKQELLLKEAGAIEEEEFELMQQSVFVQLPLPRTMREEYAELLNQHTLETLMLALETNSSEIPRAYQKVWNSYKCERDRMENDKHTKELIRQKVIMWMNANNISSANICKEIGLDPGNFSAWINKGECGRITLEDARRVLSCLDH